MILCCHVFSDETNMVNVYNATPFSLLPSQSSPWGDFVCMDQDSVNSSNRFLICSETVLTNSTSLSMQKSRWNLNHHLWNWWLFTRSCKMAVAPKPNEIPRLTNGRGNLYRVSRLLIRGGAELLAAGVHQFLFHQYWKQSSYKKAAQSSKTTAGLSRFLPRGVRQIKRFWCHSPLLISEDDLQPHPSRHRVGYSTVEYRSQFGSSVWSCEVWYIDSRWLPVLIFVAWNQRSSCNNCRQNPPFKEAWLASNHW